MIISAHLGHWYSAFGFLVPAALVILWIRYQARREQRRQEFSEYWTLELRDEQWKVVKMEPAPGSRRQRKARLRMTPPPWSTPAEGTDDGGAQARVATATTAARSSINGSSTNGSTTNGHSG
jgi:hypothetical protein